MVVCIVPDANPKEAPLPATSCSASDGGASTTEPQGLARGAAIGIGVGCGVAGLIALAALVLIWRHFGARRRRRAAAELLPPAAGGRGADEAKSVTAYSNVQSVTPNTADANYYQQHPQELDAHERVEVDGSSPLRELDTPVHQHQQQYELETPESRYYAHYDEQGNTLPRT